MEKLDIHGMKFEDAMMEIEIFIDSQFAKNPGTDIELITGYGVIRPEAVRLLESNILVSGFSDRGGSFTIRLED